MNARSPRHPVRARCELKLRAGSVAGRSRDLSASGAQISVPRALLSDGLTVGSTHEISLLLPEYGAESRARAEIVWTRPLEGGDDCVGELGVGMRFVEFFGRDEATLRSFLRSFRPEVLLLAHSGSVPESWSGLSEGHSLLWAHSPEEACRILQTHSIATILTVFTADELQESDLLAAIRQTSPRVPVVMQGAAQTSNFSVESSDIPLTIVRLSASREELSFAVRQSCGVFAMAAENEQLRDALERANESLRRENEFLRRKAACLSVAGIVGKSSAMRRMLSEVERVARSDIAVHISGETGTGKELVARAIHQGSARADAPFVAQNCAGFSDTLLLSTLFGHRKGAFTGAVRDYPGVFVAATGGTLFLDEVAELSPGAQAALLRVIQEGTLTPVGATEEVSVDVRLISATNETLGERVATGRFREDLYYRLMVIGINLPPLRERDGDVTLLAAHFLISFSARHHRSCEAFAPETLSMLEAYPWPGNVRELENEIERAVVFARDAKVLEPEHFSLRVRATEKKGCGAPSAAALADTVLEIVNRDGLGIDELNGALEREVLSRVLADARGNKSAVARKLALPRQTLLSRLKKYGL